MARKFSEVSEEEEVFTTLKRDFPDDDSELLNENHKGQGYSDETGIQDFLEKFYATEQELKK